MDSSKSYIDRGIYPQITSKLFQGKAIIVYGPRRVGKTTLLEKLMSDYPDSLYLNCDEPDIRIRLTNQTSTQLKMFFGDHQLVLLDESRRIENIGLTIKLVVDTFPAIQIVATGSSSFDLANKIKEPLTGRAYEFHLSPLSLLELARNFTQIELSRRLDNFLSTGLYPDAINHPQDAEKLIHDITSNYLYKDALEYKYIKKPQLLTNLLQALALQIGQEVSYQELAGLLGIDKDTVSAYIQILEQAFVIFRLQPLSRNLRNEINKSRKIYFWDIGIRNALINNYNPPSLRTDFGHLWENFLISERLKVNIIQLKSPNTYFWRTWQMQEVDYIEESGGRLWAFEIKVTAKSSHPPKAWWVAYPNSSFQVIDKTNFLQFLGI